MSLTSLLKFCVKPPRRRWSDIFLAGDNICQRPRVDGMLHPRHSPATGSRHRGSMACSWKIFRLKWDHGLQTELHIIEFLGHWPLTKNPPQEAERPANFAFIKGHGLLYINVFTVKVKEQFNSSPQLASTQFRSSNNELLCSDVFTVHWPPNLNRSSII